jgi:hypothetical protein
MFNAKFLRNLMNEQPFKPFRIHTRDGKSYDVTNHDNAMVTQNFIEVGIELNDDSIPGMVARCAILHITNVEDLKKTTA